MKDELVNIIASLVLVGALLPDEIKILDKVVAYIDEIEEKLGCMTR